MTKHAPHKVATIILLLVAFGIPFYLERAQISAFNTSPYLVGAALNSSTIESSQSTPLQDTSRNVNTAVVWASIAGGEFIGSRTY